MKTFDEFINDLESELGFYPDDASFKLRVTVSKLSVDYIRTVSKSHGNNLTWHINKAIDMYIQSLGSVEK